MRKQIYVDEEFLHHITSASFDISEFMKANYKHESKWSSVKLEWCFALIIFMKEKADLAQHKQNCRKVLSTSNFSKSCIQSSTNWLHFK